MNTWWSKVTRRLAVLRHLRHPSELCLVLRIVAFAAAVPMLLRLPLPRVAALLEPRQACGFPNPRQVDTIVRAVNAVLQAGKPLLRAGCLTRGLTFYYFLRRAGLSVTLCFGVGRVEDAFAGHCWLVKDGEPFLEARDPRPQFTVMYRIPDGRPAVDTAGPQRREDARTDARPELHAHLRLPRPQAGGDE